MSKEFETISISKERIEFLKENIEFELDRARERNKCITTNSHGIEWNKGLIHGYQDTLAVLSRLLRE
tara:strand:+ start:265 stop:465 length:201 start_codon:yes stop_codon:yes gene_type:complete